MLCSLPLKPSTKLVMGLMTFQQVKTNYNTHGVFKSDLQTEVVSRTSWLQAVVHNPPIHIHLPETHTHTPQPASNHTLYPEILKLLQLKHVFDAKCRIEKLRKFQH